MLSLDQDSKNDTPEKQSPITSNVLKGKQVSYNNFSSHFKKNDNAKITKPSSIANPLYKRMTHTNKSMSSKNEFVKKQKKFNFDL